MTKYVITVDHESTSYHARHINEALVEDRLHALVDDIDQLLGDGPARTRWYINEDA